MTYRLRPAIVLACLACLAPMAALHAEDAPPPSQARPQLSLGIKVWNSYWSTYMPGALSAVTPAGAYALADSFDAVEGGRRTAVLPVIGLRYRDLALSASYAHYTGDFSALHSAVIAPNGANVLTARTDHLARSESDLTAAYFVTPNVALSLGYKYAKESRDSYLAIRGSSAPVADATFKGVVFGALASFPIQGGLRFYGQLGYGPARVNITLADGGRMIDSSGQYLISEIGLNYALSIVDPYIKGASAGLGYRSQVQRTHGTSLSYPDQHDFRDTKDGIVFSLTVAL